MATDDSRSQYQAILIPDPSVEVWPAESTPDSEGIHVGHPSTSSEMVLQAERVELGSALSDDILITAQTGGLPAPSPDEMPASYVWRYDSDPDTLSRGWDAPTVISGYTPIEHGDGTTTHTRLATMAAASSGRVYLAWEYEDGSGRSIRVRYRDPGDTSWTVDTASAVSGLDGDRKCYPELLALPDGRVILYYWRHDSDNDAATIGAHERVSGTWTQIARSVVADPLVVVDSSSGSAGEYDRVHRISTAELDGRIVMLVAVRTVTNGRTYTVDTYRQYASSDGGYHFSFVGEWEDLENNGGRWQTVASDSDGYHLVHAVLAHSGSSPTYASAKSPAEHRVIGSPYEPFEAATATEITSANWGYTTVTSGTVLKSKISAGRVAYCITDDGAHWAHGVQVGTGSTEPGRARVSHDRGLTWLVAEYSSSGTEGWWQVDTGVAYPGQPVTIAHEGRVLMAARSGSTVLGYSALSVIELGGYSSRTLPPVGPTDTQAGYTYTWLPFDKPDSGTWTRTPTGAYTESLVTGEMALTADAGLSGSVEYAASLSSYVSGQRGIFGRFVVRTTRDTSDGPGYTVVVIQSDGVSVTYGFEIHVYDTKIEIYEKTGAASTTLGGTVTQSVTADVEVLWVLSAGVVTTHYRVIDDGHDRLYTQLDSTSGLTNIYANFTTSSITMDLLGTDSSTTTLSEWAHTEIGHTDERAPNLITQVNPDDLNARGYSQLGSYVAEKVTVKAFGGPVAVGDTHTVSTAYLYPIENTLTPSPRHEHRATGTVKLAYRWSTEGDSVSGSDVLGVAVLNGHLSQPTIALYDADASAWVDVFAPSGPIMPVEWERYGDTIVPKSGTANDYLIRMGEFDGAYFTEGTNYAPIKRTFGGKWAASGTRLASLKLDAATAGSIGAMAASGTSGWITPRHHVVMISLGGAKYSGLRITLSASADGRIGTVVIGPVVVHPDRQSWGRVLELESQVDLDDLGDGAQRATVRGAPRRIAEVSWADGVDTRVASVDSDDPGYHVVESNSGDPVALTGTTPWQIAGLMRSVDGGASPVVYLPRVPASGWTAGGGGAYWQALHRRADMIYGRLSDRVRLETVQGDEGVDEVIRIATLAIIEEV